MRAFFDHTPDVYSCVYMKPFGSCRKPAARTSYKTNYIKGLYDFLGSPRNPPDPHLLPDAELREDLAQKIVRREHTGDLAQGLVGQAQFFGQQVQGLGGFG